MRGPRRAIAAAACIGVAALTAEVLKHSGLVSPNGSVLTSSGPSWPSTHSAAVAAVAGAATLITRSQSTRRIVAATATGFVLLCCVSLLIIKAHRPTDLAGGPFIAGFVCSAAWWLLVCSESPPELAPRGSVADRAARER